MPTSAYPWSNGPASNDSGCRNRDTSPRPADRAPEKRADDDSRPASKDWGRTPAVAGPTARPREYGWWSYGGQPFAIFGQAAVDRVEKQGLDFLGGWPTTSGADRAAIEFPDRRDFGGGSGEKRFVSQVNVVARLRPGLNLQPQIARQFHHGASRDAGQAGHQLRLDQLAIAHDEQVLPGPFGHETLGVQQQGLVVSVARGFEVGQDRVHVVPGRLGADHGHVDVVARVRGGLHPDALLQSILAQV